MAHFIVSATGRASTRATRIGTKKTGVDAHARGWDIGGRVSCWHADDTDYVALYITAGSNNSYTDAHVATFKLTGDGPKRVEASAALQAIIDRGAEILNGPPENKEERALEVLQALVDYQEVTPC